MVNKIHPTAIIEGNVSFGKNVYVGPYSVISGDVQIGDDCHFDSHVVVKGNTKIGNGNKFFSFSSIGNIPQDLKFENELSQLEIGNNNIFREHVTVHTGTKLGNRFFDRKNLTSIGSENLFMVGAHIAHDCFVGNNIILANNATLAGHTVVEDFVIIGGLSAVQQFVRVGAYSIIGGMSGVERDVLPYSLVMGERAFVGGINLVGLKRKSFSSKDVSDIKAFYDKLYSVEDNLSYLDKLAYLEEKFSDNDRVKIILYFLKNSGMKQFCKPKRTSL